MSDEAVIVCVACDCASDEQFETLRGAGPFCRECWEALCDPDQSLLLEKRVAAYEVEVERLRGLLIRVADVLTKQHGNMAVLLGCSTCELIQELREEARCVD